jgi:HD superfamily phosphodiesterase
LQAQKALLESFIGLVARAIDAKSPYTYGHCQRVPELTKMLARAACNAREGPFAEFDLNNEQWEALHIAGWLHDCGKVTTPEYVVDKATKLETIFDRIHVIRMRVEVLKRDAEIASLKKMVAGADAASANAEKDALWRTLDEEFAFIATCNEGGEFMAPDKIERLRAIGARTWQRTLDDRLGVSWEEAKRMSRTPKQALPVTETLLADKPEHIIERREQDVITADNPWGFKLKVPEHKYNRGELYNLVISRGTLTEEERYMINDHIVQSIIMLSELPFPEHLKPVPELAGGHHEKMDGTGYPKQLARDAMSVQARIMAIADIFEALTASDRPYKKAKKLSEAVKIMSFMTKDQHIDAELFELFLTSGVYKQFAEKFLEPQYIDEVDINAYVINVNKGA